jgi:hypothetical protein
VVRVTVSRAARRGVGGGDASVRRLRVQAHNEETRALGGSARGTSAGVPAVRLDFGQGSTAASGASGRCTERRRRMRDAAAGCQRKRLTPIT